MCPFINGQKYFLGPMSTNCKADVCIALCPICKVGNIIPRKSGISARGSRSRYVFYGCSNFEYSCKYKFTKFDSDPGWIEDDYFERQI